MIGREQILTLVPHQGEMCLWDAVDAWTAGAIALRSSGHRDPAHPLRSDGVLRALHLCEYGAQAMAVHGGLRGREQGSPVRPGMLVALRGVNLHVDRIDTLDGDLECVAEVLMEAGDSQQYSFRISSRGRLLAEGRAAVMLGPASRGAPGVFR